MQEDEKALQAIKTNVRGRLAKTAAMSDSKVQYSLQAQMDFQKVYDYVSEWLGQEETATRGAGKSDRMQDLLAKIRKLLEEYET